MVATTTRSRHRPDLSSRAVRYHSTGDVAEVAPSARSGTVARFNRWLAIKVTDLVGTMWCAYVFAGLALLSLPSAVASGSRVILISWVSQTFLQLVLLSVIMAGQSVQADKAACQANATLDTLNAVLERAIAIQERLQVLSSCAAAEAESAQVPL